MAEKCNDAHNHTSCFAATIILLRWIFEVQFSCIISGLSLQEKKKKKSYSKAPRGLSKIVLTENTNEVTLSGQSLNGICEKTGVQEFGNLTQAPQRCEMSKF